ncbi:nicotinate-nucleotide adenylyltransferase [Brucella sp. NBRC 12950]|uniref:nicotinate-nucleotide adenylyltransferase n=1 Tax=Brucella sp. NBRC 12950 TaxID=2994518 RepID=UPI0024A2A0F8|nr:nicotinate-nucleotide adenylyltransferase [Brucella sp. NBRC 12950]GLU28542.1 putative nicotinate-nucleotide adenylyltransferase [Brucella sp. NBRC 12950]
MKFGFRLSALKASYPDVDAQYLRMPHVEKGMTVGLFGGSFNPPHGGHALVAEIAIRRLKLDQLWWMVTPGNPLKDKRELAPLAERLELSEHVASDPRIKVTALEAAFDVRYTADTLALIRKANPSVHFVWVMGADNLASFHRWQRWREIAQNFPIAVIDRPGSTLAYLSSRMAQTFSDSRLDEHYAPLLARRTPPAWTFIHGPRSSLSSTALRKQKLKK